MNYPRLRSGVVFFVELSRRRDMRDKWDGRDGRDKSEDVINSCQ